MVCYALQLVNDFGVGLCITLQENLSHVSETRTLENSYARGIEMSGQAAFVFVTVSACFYACRCTFVTSALKDYLLTYLQYSLLWRFEDHVSMSQTIIESLESCTE